MRDDAALSRSQLRRRQGRCWQLEMLTALTSGGASLPLCLSAGLRAVCGAFAKEPLTAVGGINARFACVPLSVAAAAAPLSPAALTWRCSTRDRVEAVVVSLCSICKHSTAG